MPMALVAVTVQVYAASLVSPLIMMGESVLVPVKVVVPSVQEASYPVTAEPPSSDTVTCR